MLQQLINKVNQSSTSTTIGSGEVVQKGNNPLALHVTRPSTTSWIVDYGASDHMTGDRSLFSSYSLCFSNLTIRIADGSCSKVAGTGTVYISPTLILKSVLFVPNLDCNLISMHKLNRDLNCETKFVANSCVFQDLE